ncbi:MAG TPA: tetratricopeptide repeat protein [Caldilineaceae bacterium]|nr:tetratricopeptide repeat protein [Caldilineaceae bacterium]
MSWTEAEFVRLVNDTLKQVHSVLALARSPLANTSLVAPLLVLDEVSPTADERGQALRLLLRWAVEQLAPGPVAYPLGEYRPLDDPTWREPPWWRYNILRHRYLEPLHPDEFIEGGRVTETLLALTGIPSPDTFFDERNRAIREVAQWLRQQMETGQADDELRELALAEATRPLQSHRTAAALLDIAATFDEVFPRALLLQMAAAEHLPAADEALDYLTQRRFLLVGDEAQNLYLSPVLRRYIYQRQSRAALLSRHRRAAAYYLAEDAPMMAARHLQAGHRWAEAAALLLARAGELIDELHVDDLVQALNRFQRSHLAQDQWREVQLLLSDLHRSTGRQTEALAACRRALQATDEPALQARIYRRMGKLYEQHNQLHALGYYQQAAERFAPDDPERVEMLKDRAWLYILRQQWPDAEADLTQALALQPARSQRADLEDALASLYRHQKRYDQAIAHARDALALREEIGDLLRVAKSCQNLGLIYNDMGDYRHAIAAYREAIAAYSTLGNRELIAGALLNIGLAHHLDGRLSPAVQAYRECLALCQEIGLPLVEARAHSNLAEALVELGEVEAARRHWQTGFHLSVQAGFDDELAYYRQLLQQVPALLQTDETAAAAISGGSPVAQVSANGALSVELPPGDRAILDLAGQEGRLTPRQLMEALGVSKATATRRLAELAAQGYLYRFGKGRGAYYAPAAGPLAPLPTVPAVKHPSPRPASNEARDPATGKPDSERTGTADRKVAGERLGPVHLARFYQQSARLQSAYGLVALGLVGEPTSPGAIVRLAVRFARPPDLAGFFTLEAELGRLLDFAVDLLPADLMPALPVDPLPAVTWVWQAKDFQG